MGTRMVSAAVNAFTVSNPNEGGQPIRIKSFWSLIAAMAVLSRISREMTDTSSTSAPAKWILEGDKLSVFIFVGTTVSLKDTSLMITSQMDSFTSALSMPNPLVVL